ncbi:unknown [Firmicutes bacterium CAG:238]|nr:unknown [Firmicutes bacterium CAG:238]
MLKWKQNTERKTADELDGGAGESHRTQREEYFGCSGGGFRKNSGARGENQKADS